MRETRVVTDRADFRSVAADAAGARVPVALRAVVDDPYDAYRRARDGDGAGHGDGADAGQGHGGGEGHRNGADAGHAGSDPDAHGAGRGVFLETTGGQSGWGYFAVDPVDFLTVAPEAVVADPDADAAHTAGVSPTLEALDGLLAGESLARGDCEVPYPCGAFGWLSYDVARELEAIPASNPPDRDLPRLQVGVYDRVVAWEEPRDAGGDADAGGDGDAGEAETTVTVTACPRVPADATADPDALDDLYDAALERARDLVERAATGDPGVGAAPAPGTEATFESNCGRAAFADRVRAVKRYVRDGDTFQANISQRLEAPAAVHPVEAYDALRRVNPAPYSALLEFPGVDLVSASPELLLERRGDRLLTEPIAGTRPRGDSDAEDEALEADLVGDEKERAEHAMLVDLERNDLGKVSTYGTVTVPEYRRVDRYSEVMHLVSLVEGELRAGVTLSDAVAAVFPGGTITGAPKPRTMEIIEELESRRRGPYTGSIGVFGFDGRATLNIVIRTLVRHGDEYHLSVGAGIVHDSEPEREYEETLDKARALVRAVTAALERGRLTVEGGEP